MKIIIEGEPKEIADFELALKDGKKTVFGQKIKVRGAKIPDADPFETAIKRMCEIKSLLCD